MNKDQRKTLRDIDTRISIECSRLEGVIELLTPEEGVTPVSVGVVEIKEQFLDPIIATLECLRDEIEEQMEEEEAKYENLSENFQQGSMGEAMEAAIEQLQDALTFVAEAVGNLDCDTLARDDLVDIIQNAIDDELSSAQGSIEDACSN